MESGVWWEGVGSGVTDGYWSRFRWFGSDLALLTSSEPSGIAMVTTGSRSPTSVWTPCWSTYDFQVQQYVKERQTTAIMAEKKQQATATAASVWRVSEGHELL